jgi:hypothetical protein
VLVGDRCVWSRQDFDGCRRFCRKTASFDQCDESPVSSQLSHDCAAVAPMDTCSATSFHRMKSFHTVTLLWIVSSLSSCTVSAFRPSTHPNDAPILNGLSLPPPIASTLPETKATTTSSCSSSSSRSSNPSVRQVLKPITTLRKKWGVDNENPQEYWFDDRIHVFGNHGFWGAVHAAVAPLSTHLIDVAAYNGVDIRQRVRSLGSLCTTVRTFVSRMLT